MRVERQKRARGLRLGEAFRVIVWMARTLPKGGNHTRFMAAKVREFFSLCCRGFHVFGREMLGLPTEWFRRDELNQGYENAGRLAVASTKTIRRA